MTPQELLREVKDRFTTLLHREDEKLKPLLKQALTTYQDKAGVVRQINVMQSDVVGGDFTIPELMLKRVGLKSASGAFMRHMVMDDKICVNARDLAQATYPLRFTYLLHLRDVSISTFQLPPNIIGLLSDYLYVLIQIPNSERLRRVQTQGGIDTSDIPSEESLQSRKTELEISMKSAKASPSMVTL